MPANGNKHPAISWRNSASAYVVERVGAISARSLSEIKQLGSPASKDGYDAPTMVNAHPTVIARDPRTGLQIRIGVMGSAADDLDAAVTETCHKLGQSIASRGCCLLTGACHGMPHETVVGSRSAGGHVVGISPASTLKEHVEVHHSPYREYDVLIFTGMGMMGRELMNIYSSDIVIVVGGRSGTLGEFAIAYEAGKLIGVLQGTGGITTAIPELETALAAKRTGAEVLYDDNPVRLVDRLLQRYQSGEYRCPCHPKHLP